MVINDRRRDAERRHHRTPQLDTSKLRPRYLHYSKIIFLAARNPGILESWDPVGPHFSSLSPSEPTGSEQAHRGGDRAGSPCTCGVLELARACSSMLTHTRHVHVTTHWCHVTSRLQTLHFGLSVTFLDMMDRSDTSVAQTVDSLQTSNFMHV